MVLIYLCCVCLTYCWLSRRYFHPVGVWFPYHPSIPVLNLVVISITSIYLHISLYIIKTYLHVNYSSCMCVFGKYYLSFKHHVAISTASSSTYHLIHVVLPFNDALRMVLRPDQLVLKLFPSILLTVGCLNMWRVGLCHTLRSLCLFSICSISVYERTHMHILKILPWTCIL